LAIVMTTLTRIVCQKALMWIQLKLVKTRVLP